MAVHDGRFAMMGGDMWHDGRTMMGVAAWAATHDGWNDGRPWAAMMAA